MAKSSSIHPIKNTADGKRLKTAILFIQLLLPFGLYIAYQRGWMFLVYLIAGFVILSMAVLVWTK
jgi:hypothetical protein